MIGVVEWTAVATVTVSTAVVATLMKFVPWVIRRGIEDTVEHQLKALRKELDTERKKRIEADRRLWDALEGRREW